MDTEALRWFQQVADGVTVTEVGEMFWVTQSGVSRGLARLEAEVGTPLLRRSGRVLRMTHAGTVFKRHLDVMLHELDDGLAAVQELLDPERGTVALDFQPSLGTWLVPHLVEGFRSRRPGVQFALHQSRDDLVPHLVSGQVDLGLGQMQPGDRTLTWHRLFSDPLCVALPPGHPSAARDRLWLHELAGEGFVMLRHPSLVRRHGVELCERAGFHPVVALEADDLPTVRALVAAGLGVAVVPAARQGTPDADRSILCHVPIADPGATREIGLAHSTQRRPVAGRGGLSRLRRRSSRRG